MTRSDFIASNPILAVMESRQIKVTGTGQSRMAKCPFHGDTNASMSVNLKENTWYCHACSTGGGVIDLMAKLAQMTPVDFIKQHGIEADGHRTPIPEAKPIVEVVYPYTDALGRELFQVVRLKPKSFRQRHKEADGNWVWSMEGVERVLYHLPEVVKAETVWIVEGEKDADNLCKLGFVATCNVGGAGKWLGGYTDTLAGKHVIICGDNDDAGRKHVETVFDSIAGKVKTAKLVKIPAPCKDVSDYIAQEGEHAKEHLDALAADATPFVNGVRLPVYSMAELEPRYIALVRSPNPVRLDLGAWLPSLRWKVRPIMPGEVVLVLGDTGTGKTALLQNIAFNARPMPTLFFQMELPEELMFERFLGIVTRVPCTQVEKNYREQSESFGDSELKRHFPGLFICPESRLTLEKLEHYINKAELKMGEPPILVIVDYVQLMAGNGKRYERTSDTAEGLKAMAKTTNTIIVAASQIARPESSGSPEIGLHTGKDSGSLENSAGLVLGAWRDDNDSTLLHLRVLKNTKGTGKTEVLCNFDGETMRITERSPIQPNDYPGAPN